MERVLAHTGGAYVAGEITGETGAVTGLATEVGIQEGPFCAQGTLVGTGSAVETVGIAVETTAGI